MIGIGLALLAASGFGATAILARLGLRRMSTAYGVLLSMVVSAALALAIAAALHPGEIAGVVTNLSALGWFLLVGVLNFPLGRTFNYLSVRLAGVSRASTVVATSPLFATALAVALLDEAVNAPILLGTAAIIVGLILTLYQKE